MTREKAKEIISYHKYLVDKDKSGLLDKELEYEAIDMAIKALEQESCEGKMTNQEKFIQTFGILAWQAMIVFTGLEEQYKEYWESPYKECEE